MLLRDAEARARVKNTSSSSYNTTGKTVRLAALVSCENAIVAARQLTWLSTRVTSSFLNLAIIIEATANIKSPAIVTYKEKKTHISKRNHIIFEKKKTEKANNLQRQIFGPCNNM